jgi:predicted HAD superfamily phosphohydrolase YqeG
MRYRNKFQRSSYPTIAVEPLDEGAELDEKWRRWIDRERWKRYVLWIQDTHVLQGD